MFVSHKLCKVLSNRFYFLVTTLQGNRRDTWETRQRHWWSCTLERFYLFKGTRLLKGRAAIRIWQVHLSSKTHTAYILLPLQVLFCAYRWWHLQNCLNELLFFNQVISIFHLSIFHLIGICFVLSSALGAVFFNPLYTQWVGMLTIPS